MTRASDGTDRVPAHVHGTLAGNKKHGCPHPACVAARRAYMRAYMREYRAGLRRRT